jgi:hypothetical protein
MRRCKIDLAQNLAYWMFKDVSSSSVLSVTNATCTEAQKMVTKLA